MRATLIALAFAAAAAAGQASSAPEARPTIITNPDWLEKPTVEDVGHAYPEAALLLDVSGQATLSCRVDAEGRLAECEVPVERPRGFGFGKAALDLAPSFRLRPQTVDGRPSGTGIVRIPLKFAPWPSDTQPPIGQTPSADALRIARAWATAAKPEVAYLNAAFREVDEAGAYPGRSPSATTAKAQAAVRDALRARQAALQADLAEGMARVLSLPELQQMADFSRSPAGAVLAAEPIDPTWGAAADRLAPEFFRATHQAFCALASCALPQPPTNLPASTVRNPEFYAEPGFNEVLDLTPVGARLTLTPGRAYLLCQGGPDGQLVGCRVLAEGPTGMGFGAAALALAPKYRLTNAPGDHPVLLTANFAFPPLPPPMTAPAGRSTASMTLARQLVALEPELSESIREMEQPISPEDLPLTALAPSLREPVRQATAAGARQVKSDMIDTIAAPYTLEFSDEQLSAAVAFLKNGPLAAKGAQVREARAWAWNRFRRSAASQARAAVCPELGCDLEAAAPQPISDSPAASTRTP